nr:hypothetical protein [Tanacetum cinerariifolium]
GSHWKSLVYKFEGNALAWWKAYKQAEGGDAWLITVTRADFNKLFFLQFFPRAEQERLKREYHSIRQTNTETSTEFMQRFLRLAGMMMTLSDQISGRRVVIDVSRPLNRVVTGTKVIITTVMDQTGDVVVTTTAAATTTTLAVTTGIPSRGPSKGYSYPVYTTCGRRHPGECRRAAGACFKCGQASHLQIDCKKNTTASTSGQADKKPVIEMMTTVNQGMSVEEIERVVAQRVANAIEAIAIYETKTNLARKSMSQTERQKEK